MNKINNKILPTFLLFFTMFLGYFWYRHTQNNTSFYKTTTQEGLVGDVNQGLIHDEAAVWGLITAHTGITHEQCLKDKQEHIKEEYEIYKRSNIQRLKRSKKISPPTQQFIKKILQDFDIAPQSIDVVPYKGNGSPAAADDWTLFVDEQDLLSYPIEARQFILGHEIMHIKLQDHSIHCALHRLVPKKNKKVRGVLYQFDRFQETRADTLAMLKGGIYAQGGISFLTKLYQREGGNFEAPSHPKTTDRIALAKNIHVLSNSHDTSKLA